MTLLRRFDAVRRVDADLGRDLMGRSGADHATVAAVQPLGALTDHDEVNLLASSHPVGERAGHAGVEPARTEVHVVVKGEPQLQQQSALQQAGGDLGVAGGGSDRAQQDGIALVEGRQIGVGEDLAGPLPSGRSEIELDQVEGVWSSGGVQHLDRLGGHLGADAVSTDHGDGGLVRGVGFS